MNYQPSRKKMGTPGEGRYALGHVTNNFFLLCFDGLQIWGASDIGAQGNGWLLAVQIILSTLPYLSILILLCPLPLPLPTARDENGLDTDGYHWYYICFHIYIWIRIQIRIVSTMPDMIRLDIDVINMRFEYPNTDTVSNVEYPDSDTDRSKPLEMDSVSNTVGKDPYRFHAYLQWMNIY
jgi:hypothetical protein